MSLIFWDTHLFVYWMEDHPEFAPMIAGIRQRMLERKDRLCTSAMTLGEILCGPCSRGDEELAQRYDAALAPPYLEVIPFDREAAKRYARIRCDKTVSPADAIQLACAAQAGVDLFLTNDRRLSRKTIPGIQFIGPMDADIL